MKRLLVCIICVFVLFFCYVIVENAIVRSTSAPTLQEALLPSILSTEPELSVPQFNTPVTSSCEQQSIASEAANAYEGSITGGGSANTELPEDSGAELPFAKKLPKICIDPGHYEGGNQIYGEKSYGYAEGDFTLQVAIELQKILLEKYGIESCITRSARVINLPGYTIEDMGSVGLESRVEVAMEQDCDFLFSIHTNANLPDANQYPTLLQPIQITKTIVLVNAICCDDATWISVANEVGKNLSKVNVEEGFAEDRPFLAGKPGSVPEWTDAWNDSLTATGAVLCRHGERGDYYGLLRCAAENGLPAVIVEHGFHTVPEMRNVAMNGDLAQRWAEADADGIALGLGITPIR